MEYIRECPRCKKEITHKSWSGYYNSIKNNRLCKRCAYNNLIGKKRIFTEEHKRNLGEAHKKSKIFQEVMHSKEYREKLRKANTGKKHSQETKDKISKGNKGKIINADIRERLKKSALLFYENNPDYKEKMRDRFYRKFVDKIKCDNIEPLFKRNNYDPSKKQFYDFLCKTCNLKFSFSIFGGRIPKCKNCYPKIKSKIQNEIYNKLKEITNSNILQNCRTLLDDNLELDFYFIDKNIAIEYNSLYWHSELNGKDKNYHLNKTVGCEKKGIQLIQIFEDEWKNKKDIIISKINHMLMLNNRNKVFARNCHIKKIDNSLCKIFLEKYHIQGNLSSPIRYGAFHNEELVAIMTFSKSRISLGSKPEQGSYELSRFCTSKNCVGIASKFIHLFIKEYRPKNIISYADRRYSSGNLYKSVGFKFVSNSKPNYWYTKDYRTRIHRFNFRKNVLKNKLETYDKNLTEWENMQLNGYDRVWDCGSLKYEMEC